VSGDRRNLRFRAFASASLVTAVPRKSLNVNPAIPALAHALRHDARKPSGVEGFPSIVVRIIVLRFAALSNTVLSGAPTGITTRSGHPKQSRHFSREGEVGARETTAGSAGDAGGGAPEVDFLNQKPTPIVVPTPPVLCPPPEYDDACAAGRSRFACWGGEGSALPFRRDNWGLLFWLGFSSSF